MLLVINHINLAAEQRQILYQVRPIMHFAKLRVLGHSELLMVINVDKRNSITLLLWLR